MEAPGIHLALWLLTFTMLLPMLSTELMFPPGVRDQLCESGHLGSKQKWECGRGKNGDGEGNSGNLGGISR